MRTLIPLVIKVEIMLNRLITTLRRAHGRKRDRHVKLAPSLLLDLERRALDDLLHALAEGLVEDVGGLFVAVGRNFFAVRADEVDDDAPGAHGEAFHFLRFIAVTIVSVMRGFGRVGFTYGRIRWVVMSLTVRLTCFPRVTLCFILLCCRAWMPF